MQYRVRELIREGLLPDISPSYLWGGYGKGGSCSVCEGVIGPNEVQYELDIRAESDKPHFIFHIPCHAAWHLECATARLLRERSGAAKPKGAPFKLESFPGRSRRTGGR